MSADNSMRRAGASGGVVAYIYAEVFVAACGLQLVLLLLLLLLLGS